jgi:hypothetical protein
MLIVRFGRWRRRLIVAMRSARRVVAACCSAAPCTALQCGERVLRQQCAPTHRSDRDETLRRPQLVTNATCHKLSMSSSTLAVEPFDAQLDFGCRVAGLSSLRSVSDANIATLATAFQQHGLVVIPKVAGLQPELELELYHHVHEKLWPAAAVSTRPRPPYSARDAHPPSFPEINVIGNGTVCHVMPAAARICEGADMDRLPPHGWGVARLRFEKHCY